MKIKLQLYTRFERFWHWSQAFLIIFLLITGFEVHGSCKIFGYAAACRWHNLAGITLLILSAFAIFWHLTTGQWRHYKPSFENLRGIIGHYLVLLPLQLVSGLLYYYYNDWINWGWAARLDGVAFLHTAMAFAMLLFLVVHVYLTTTGGTLLTYTKSMFTGWEEVDDGIMNEKS